MEEVHYVDDSTTVARIPKSTMYGQYSVLCRANQPRTSSSRMRNIVRENVTLRRTDEVLSPHPIRTRQHYKNVNL